MKPAFNSLSAKRLPLTLAAACLGIGVAGLVVTLHRPVDLSPFRPAPQPPLAEQNSSFLPVVTPEPFHLVLEGTTEPEPLAPEATPEAARAVAATRPFVPVVIAAAPVATAAPEPSPEPGPSVSAAASGSPVAVADVTHASDPVPSKDTAGAPPEPFSLQDEGVGKDSAAAAPLPAPAAVVARPELTEEEPSPDVTLPEGPKDKPRKDEGPDDKSPRDKAPKDDVHKDEGRK